MKKFILIHYSEIGLKKTNKNFFVKKLILAIRKRFLQDFGKGHRIVEGVGRILVDFDEGIGEEDYVKSLKKVFGIRYFRFVLAGSLDLDELLRQVADELKCRLLWGAESFLVRVKRSQNYKMSSGELERELGAKLLDLGAFESVKMKGAAVEVNLELFNESAFFSFERFEGAGGFPWGSESRMLSLISAGFDSPVAAFKMMRKGVHVIFLHFHAYPYTDEAEIENVKELVKILADYQFGARLFLVPFADFQKAVAQNLAVPAKLRVLIYRRMMLRVACALARREKAYGLVTGDSLGQVASQTPENLLAVDQVADFPVYRPLISLDKEEIVDEARLLCTYDISERPCRDTCTMFSPKRPEIRAKLQDLLAAEEKIDVEGELAKCLAGIELFST